MIVAKQFEQNYRKCLVIRKANEKTSDDSRFKTDGLCFNNTPFECLEFFFFFLTFNLIEI